MMTTPIRAENRKLALIGLRICELCKATMALDRQHFYVRTQGGRPYFAYTCIRCWRLRENEKARKRYHHDADHRRKKIEAAKVYHWTHREKRCAHQRAYMYRKLSETRAPLKLVKPVNVDSRKRDAFRRIYQTYDKERFG